jgi:hypothetical protein
MTPVLNKLLKIQLIIQKKVEWMVFGNDTTWCYDRMISGIVMMCLKRIGYSSNSVRMIGLLWAQVEHPLATGYEVSHTIYSSTLEKTPIWEWTRELRIPNSMGIAQSIIIDWARRIFWLHNDVSSGWRVITCAQVLVEVKELTKS